MALVVAAVNFGIRETCIGLTLKGEKAVHALNFYDKDAVVHMKVPSCALLNHKGQLDCYGFIALAKFNDLKSERKIVGWKYFQTFPALKNTESINGEFYISDETGERFSANKLFAEIVGYLKDMLFSDVLKHFSITDVTWVFSIPASWDSRAKTCLTNSGVQVGLSADHILLITDAEAASFTCLEELHNIGANKKCLLVNWNESYTEFAEVESNFDQTIRVTFLEGKHSADMNTVQEKILSFMGLLLDDDTGIHFDDFRDKLDFTRKLRFSLQKLSLEGTGNVHLNLPLSLGQRFCEIDMRNKHVFGSTAKYIGGKLRMSNEMLARLVLEALESTIAYVDEIVSRPENRNLTDVIFFGDFAEYQIATDALHRKLKQRIHKPEDAETAILKGGLLFGRSPEIVTSRILRIATHNENGSDIWAEPKVTANHQVFAAFDFGTTYSGYAYSVKNTPAEIWANKAWSSGEKLLSLKTPTSVLLKPDKTFDSFGFEAENKYSSLVEDDEHGDWMLFRQFKMLLHQIKDGLRRDTTVEDISGKKMPALTIFSMAIRYLKEQLMETLRLRIADISQSDILFVITVPAIWSDGAKQFMKEAALQAGIDSQQVGLALEPEAAAIWCQHIQTDVKGELSKPGTQFMVVDIGGGTADISVQEKKPDGRLKEIHRPDGGAWGGTNVDKEFFDWLGSIFGQKRIRQFRESEFGEHLDLLNEFEIKKRSIGSNNIAIRLPYSMRENSKKIKKSIDTLGLSEKVSLTKDKLKVDAEIAKRWFNATISNIASHVSNLLQEQHFKDVSLVMVVGGFAECKLLQSAMIETLSNVRVIIPEEAGVAVLKGAVEFAQRPHVIASRVMKCSYGINKPVEYDAKVHDSSKVVIENGKKVVHLFEQFVKINNEVKIGEVVAKGVKPTSLKETKVDIYSSPHPNPRYVSDRECTKIAQINVKHESGKTANDKIFDVLFEFGKTEVFVRVILRISGEEFGTKLECL